MVDNSTDKLFQKAFENAPIPGPSEEGWTAISEQAGLAGSSGLGISAIASKGGFIALLVVCVGTAAYLFSASNQSATANSESVALLQAAEQIVTQEVSKNPESQINFTNAQEEAFSMQDDTVTAQAMLSNEPVSEFEAATFLKTESHESLGNRAITSQEGIEFSNTANHRKVIAANQLAGEVDASQSNKMSILEAGTKKDASLKSAPHKATSDALGTSINVVNDLSISNSASKRQAHKQVSSEARIADKSTVASIHSVNRGNSSLFAFDVAPVFIKSDALAKLIVINRKENGPWLIPTAPKTRTSANVETSGSAGNGQIQLLPYFSFDHELSTYTIADRYASGELNIQEDRALAYSIGMRARYLFKHRFTADLGMYFVDKGSLNGTLQGADESLKTDIQVESQYLEVPISIGYRLPLEGYGLSFNAGVHLRKNLGSSESVLVEQDFTTGNSYSIQTNASSYGVGLLTSFAVDFRISKSASFFIEPAYRYAFNPMILVDESNDYTLPFNAHLSAFSLGTGIIFTLK